MSDTNLFITRRPHDIALKLHELRRDWLSEPEKVGFRRLDNSICYKKFNQQAKITYKDTSIETNISVIYSDIDFTWGWSNENEKINNQSNWKGYSVGGLYCIIDGARHFLAKVTPTLSMSIDAGIRTYITQDVDNNRNPLPGSKSILHMYLDTLSIKVIDNAEASADELPFGNTSAKETTHENNNKEEKPKITKRRARKT